MSAVDVIQIVIGIFGHDSYIIQICDVVNRFDEIYYWQIFDAGENDDVNMYSSVE